MKPFHADFEQGLAAAFTGPGRPEISFEFFPGGTPEKTAMLDHALELLAPLGPRFVSITCGAAGSTRDLTAAACAHAAGFGVPVAAHLTAAGASRAQVDAEARAHWEAGIRRIVALRGDGGPPGTPFHPHAEGYRNAAELVAGLQRIAPFDISVAAYPECHPQSPSVEADIDNLKRKLDAGASRAITQFFFDPAIYLRFRDRCAAAGITAELVPGILPIANVTQSLRFARACGATIPAHVAATLEGLDSQPDTRRLVAAALAADLCSALRREGVDRFHFYTLNRAELTLGLCHLLGARRETA